MLSKLFKWIETLTDPFPPEEPEKPPTGLVAFLWHYAKPFRYLLMVSSGIAATTAVLEVWLFSFVGRIVDWLAQTDREQTAGSLGGGRQGIIFDFLRGQGARTDLTLLGHDREGGGKHQGNGQQTR